MALSIVALCIFVFGAYAYGAVVVLSLRHGVRVWSAGAPNARFLHAEAVGFAMMLVCTVWFVLHSTIEFRFLMGEPRRNDWIDLSALELVFAFPGLIFHTVLVEAGRIGPAPHWMRSVWRPMLCALYGTGTAMAIYFPLVILGVITGPRDLDPYIGISIGVLFMLSSVCSLAVMSRGQRPARTRDQGRLHTSLRGLFIIMIVVFFVLTFMRQHDLLMEVLDIVTRSLPLMFLLVSVYFGSRIEFYDLVIKRGVLLLISIALLGSVLAVSLGWLDAMPIGGSRPWLFAVVLLPVAMLMPWLHTVVGRWLDRMWFGRDFTTVEAVKHVLTAMQQATDEASLVAATESTLSEIFHRRVVILREEQPVPEGGTVASETRLSTSAELIRLATVDKTTPLPMFSEDHKLLRSLGGVFGLLLENVRLQRKRQEQEQDAQELRLQTSRSELKALRAQINPHFLFNALNAIASLIHTDPTRADAAVEQLAEVFRYTLRRSEHEWAPLDQELAFARAYLDVEQARFGRRLEFTITADDLPSHVQVPAMLLQTLVENAVKHGISRLRTPGRIDVHVSHRDGRLTLDVRDTGPGIDQPARHPAAAGESFGLRSVRDRLRGHFGAQASLDLFRQGDQTIARIELPLIEEPAAAGAAR